MKVTYKTYMNLTWSVTVFVEQNQNYNDLYDNKKFSYRD
jgi:hypothetical protein